MIVAYEKAKKYLDNLSDGIQQQIEVWIQRRDIINNDRRQHSFDFLASKTDRITELAIKTVESKIETEMETEKPFIGFLSQHFVAPIFSSNKFDALIHNRFRIEIFPLDLRLNRVATVLHHQRVIPGR